MQQFSIETRIRKHVKRYGFVSFATQYKKQLLHTRLNSLKTASQNVVHKTGEVVENKIADALSRAMI